jgi:hypothetical protein
MAKARTKLGFISSYCMAVGGMIGGGIFSILGIAMVNAGHTVPWAFLIAGLIALISGHSYVKLTGIIQTSGGSYNYIDDIFGKRKLAGTMGWYLILGYIFTNSLYAYTFAAYTRDLFQLPEIYQPILSSAIILFFMGLNLIGIKESAITENILVIGKLLILLTIAITGFFVMKETKVVSCFLESKSIKVFTDPITTAALIFVAYEGFQLLNYDYHEIKSPRKNLPRAIYASIITVIITYVMVAFIVDSVCPTAMVLKFKETILAEVAEPILGKWGFYLVAVAAAFSTSSAINATLFGTARLSYDISKERELPSIMAWGPDKHNPVGSIIVISILSLVFTLVSSLEIIASFASTCFLMIFGVVNFLHFLVSKSWWNKTISLIASIFSIVSVSFLLYTIYRSSLFEFIAVIIIYGGILLFRILSINFKFGRGIERNK